MGTSIVITSGKGGTGKTSVTGGIASCLAAMGHRVLCLDLDIGLRNLDIALGMSDQVLMDFSDVLAHRCDLMNAVAEHSVIKNLFLLTSPMNSSAGHFDTEAMSDLLKEIKEHFDYCLIDCPAGIGSGFQLATGCADRAIVVSTTEPASLRDAQMTVNKLRPRGIPIHLVVNKLSKKTLRRLRTNIDDAMDMAGLPLLGVIPEDDLVPVCGGTGQPVILRERKGAAVAYYNLARRLDGIRVPIQRF